MLDFLKDLWDFMRERKKSWLAPIILVMLLLGVLIVVAQGSAQQYHYLLLEDWKNHQAAPDFWRNFGHNLAILHQSTLSMRPSVHSPLDHSVYLYLSYHI